MIISEKQILSLMAIADDYKNKIAIMIEKNMAYGDPKPLMKNIWELLLEIRNQQSEELKVIE